MMELFRNATIAQCRNLLNNTVLKFLLSLQFLVMCLVLSQNSYSQNGIHDYHVKLKRGSFVPDARFDLPSKIKNNSNARNAFNSLKYFVVQFYHLPDAGAQLKIKNSGIELVQYVPYNAYLCAIEETPDTTILKSLNVRSIREFGPDDKVDPALDSIYFTRNSSRQVEKEVVISIFNNSSIQELKTLIHASEIKLLEVPESSRVLKAIVNSNQLTKLAGMDGIIYIAPTPLPAQRLNFKETNASRVNILRSQSGLGRNLRGDGIAIAIADEFSGSIHEDIQNRVVNVAGASGSLHGDHTSGIVGGAGNVDPLQAGMAPKSLLVLTNSANSISLTPSLYNNYNVRLTNNSYRGSYGGEYDYNSGEIDIQNSGAYGDLLHVFAAGNDGPSFNSISSSWQASKNALVVGSANESNSVSYFSSRGPLADGRIKPDVVSYGESVTSTTPVNGYSQLSGTSMSCPNVTGAAALLYERYKQIYNVNPDAGLIKALLANTADDLDMPGPDYSSGFGLINLRRAAMAMEEVRFLTGTVNAGQVAEHSITIPEGTKAAKIMLYWQDKEAFQGSSIQLVNDLNLSLSQGGLIAYPWVLDPFKPQQNAIKGIDHLNNIEQVSINEPTGNFSVKVDGSQISGLSQKYFLVYEFVKKEIVVTFPFANELLAPGDEVKIQWDAAVNGPFTVQYSIDNGIQWQLIQSDIYLKSLDWIVPDISPAKLIIKVDNGNLSGVSASGSSIFKIPQQLKVQTDPTGKSVISWEALPGNFTYDIYALSPADKEPILFASTSQNSYTYQPVKGSIKKISVSARNKDGASSRRSPSGIEVTAVAPDSLAVNFPGIKYEYFEGTWSSMPDFLKLMPSKTGFVNSIDIGKIRQRPFNYAAKMEGYLKISSSDIYDFTFRSSPGSVFMLDNAIRLEGIQSASIRLETGYYKFSIEFLNGNSAGYLCEVLFGSHNSLQRVPLSGELFHAESNLAPLVCLTTPESAAVYGAPASVSITATASDTDGTVTKVVFYNEGNLIGEDTKEPFEIAWTNIKAGTYAIKAIAIDNFGSKRSTAFNQISVKEKLVNIALNKSASSSSTEAETTDATYAFDGNMGTRWASAASDPQWLEVDLQDIYSINRIKINWETAYGRDFSLQVSTDKINWTALKIMTENTSVQNEYSDINASARYIRLLGTKRATGFGYSVYELEVNGTLLQQNPKVWLESPLQGANFIHPEKVNILANAGAGADTISMVEIFSNDMKIAEVHKEPFQILWSPPLAGNYQIFAKAYGTNGKYSFSDTILVQYNLASSNIALGKQIITSSSESAPLKSENAVDGNMETRWASTFADSQSMVIDLAQNYNLERIRIMWEAAFGKNYNILISEDSSNWTALKTVQNNTGLINDFSLTGKGRYLKFAFVTRGTGFGYSIFEIEVFGSPVSTDPFVKFTSPNSGFFFNAPANIPINVDAGMPDGAIEKVEFYAGSLKIGEDHSEPFSFMWSNVMSGNYTLKAIAYGSKGITASAAQISINVQDASGNIALLKSVKASSEESEGNLALYAVDGNPLTRWSSDFQDPQWFSVDLGNIYQISRIKISWEIASAKNFTLQFSPDNISWSDVLDVFGNATLTNNFPISSGKARYVRMLGTARNTGFGYSIYEFEVYGNLDPSARSAELSILPESFNFYPNPAGESIFIISEFQGNGSSLGKILLTNIFDIPLLEKEFKNIGELITLDIRMLENGNYFLKYILDDKIFIKRLSVVK